MSSDDYCPKQRLRDLLVMAASDGSFSSEEIAFLTLRANRIGMSEEEFSDALTYASSAEAEVEIPADGKACKELLKDLLIIMAADADLSDPEKQLFARVAAKMNIEVEEIDTIIDKLLREM